MELNVDEKFLGNSKRHITVSILMTYLSISSFFVIKNNAIESNNAYVAKIDEDTCAISRDGNLTCTRSTRRHPPEPDPIESGVDGEFTTREPV
ncbi:hypothetical protein Ddye_025534 [Dipteronia dyeriana]|uniref:Uncharacterized protein n=1 Tax=Dipteronia dyeriana TaxID=168575 RepID=A0AAD9WNB7_9ROSI|nr:hypothetical protein Ddye_025534 [Dipteronia dyeriana]